MLAVNFLLLLTLLHRLNFDICAAYWASTYARDRSTWPRTETTFERLTTTPKESLHACLMHTSQRVALVIGAGSACYHHCPHHQATWVTISVITRLNLSASKWRSTLCTPSTAMEISSISCLVQLNQPRSQSQFLGLGQLPALCFLLCLSIQPHPV
jgi:hypothetical protein